MVVTLQPSFITASVRHELMRRPSTSTVQAPHWPWSQPFLVPVRSRWSRRASSRLVHGATSSFRSTPLTVMLIASLAGGAIGSGLRARALGVAMNCLRMPAVISAEPARSLNRHQRRHGWNRSRLPSGSSLARDALRHGLGDADAIDAG